MPQDMPPVGGYGAVQYKRNLPARGFRPATLLLGGGLIVVYGWYKLIGGIREQNEYAREKIWSRIHLIPLLQAEEDRDLVRRQLADQAREKELLGENFKVYHSDRYKKLTCRHPKIRSAHVRCNTQRRDKIGDNLTDRPGVE